MTNPGTATVSSAESTPVWRGWIVIVLLFFAAIINYIDRGSLSVAAPQLSKQLSLTPPQVGLVLSAFFWTYTVFQLLAGWLADRFAVFWVFAIGFVIWSLATLGSGLVSGLTSLFILRLFLGAGESVAFPCYSKVIAAGFSPDNRGLPNSLLDAGTKLGPAIGTLVGAALVASYGWRIQFLALGGVSLLWLVPWLIWAPRPKQTSEEPESAAGSPTFLDILVRKDAWGTFLGNASYTYSYYFLLTWLPSYLVNERHVSLRDMGVLGSIPFFGAAVSAVTCGWISDRWIRRGGSPTRVRKTFVVSGLLLSVIMVPAALVRDIHVSVFLLSVAYVAFGMFASNHWAITQTLAGTAAAGRWTGLKNTVGNLSGIVAPIATGVIVGRTGSYFWAFLSPAIIAVLGACCYLFMVGPVAPVVWREKKSLAI